MPVMRFEEFCSRLENLRRDRARGPVKPYKPLLIASVLVLIAKKKITGPEIYLDGGLRSAFHQLLDEIYPDWPFAADIRYPFRHLRNDGIWTLDTGPGYGTAEAAGAKAREVMKHVVCARLDGAVFRTLTSSVEAPLKALAVLQHRYLPPEAGAVILRLLSGGDAALAPPPARIDFTERALEEYLETHWNLTPFARRGILLASRERLGFAGRQVLTPVHAIDLLGYQEAEKTWWVFELKKGRPADAVVGQVSRYLGWMIQERAGRKERAVGAVVAGNADAKLRYAVRSHPRLSLWTYDASFSLTQVEGADFQDSSGIPTSLR